MKLNTLLITVTVAILATGGGTYWYFKRDKEEISWRTTEISRGEIRQRVSGTGTLSAIYQVDVGCQVSGMVTAMYADYNSIVRRGQVIATIDPTVYEQRVAEARIQLELSTTALQNAEAELGRMQRLSEANLVAPQDLERTEQSCRSAKASYERNIIALQQAETNLGYCTITAPVDGVVVARRAEVGQTVTASMSTPSLFVIAEDLGNMKLEIRLDEMDIGQVEVGQVANFSVDAAQEHQFDGIVSQVRIEPRTQQNVVNYTVVVEFNNWTSEQIEADNERRQAEMQARMAAFAGMGMGPGTEGPRGARPGAGSDASAATQGAPGAEAQRPPRGEGRPGGRGGQDGFMIMSADGTVDYDAMWERSKDMILARQPGITKEAWIEQMRAGGQRMQQMAAAGSRPQGTTARPATRQPLPASQLQRGSSVIQTDGNFYQGEYVLLPGMTANVTIVTDQRNDVLRVPSGALRFNASQYVRDESAPAQERPAAPQQRFGPRVVDRRAQIADRGFVQIRQDRLWVLDENGKPKAIDVRAGLTDNTWTEVTSDELSEGMQILVGVNEIRGNAAQQAANPFRGGGGMMRR